MVKRSFDPREAHPEVKVHVRDLVRVVGIAATFAPRGFRIRGKFVLSSPRGYMGTGELCRVPQAAVHHGRARQSSGTGPCVYCRKVLLVLGLAGQYSGEICFIEKPGVQDEGGRHVVKRSSDPREAHPEVIVHVWDLVRIVDIEPQRVVGHSRPVLGAPNSGTLRESQAKIRDWTMWVV